MDKEAIEVLQDLVSVLRDISLSLDETNEHLEKIANPEIITIAEEVPLPDFMQVPNIDFMNIRKDGNGQQQ